MGRILLSGYYGFGNTGDEAILSSTIGALREKDPSVDITVLSRSPRETGRTYNVCAKDRMSPKEVIQAIKEADLVVFGGGSLLQDSTSFRSLAYYVAFIYAAKLLGKPLVVYANGIGPVRSTVGRLLVGHAISTASRVTVRDDESRRELMAMGFKKQVTVTADPAFLLPEPDPTSTDRILSSKDLLGKTNIVWLALRPNRAPEWFYKGAGQVILYLRSRGYLPCLLMMQKQDEAVLHRLKQVGQEEALSGTPILSGLMPGEALGLLQRGAFCVGMRLHTLILSARASIPFIGVEIDPKIGAFCRMAGCPTMPDPSSTDPYSLTEHIDAFIAHQEMLRTLISQKLPGFTALARSNIDMVFQELRTVTSGSKNRL